jgi:acyl-CoA dehydrogenase
LQQAIDLSNASQAARKKLQQALKSGVLKPAPGESEITAALAAGLLDDGEAQQLQAAETARRQVIDVDDFAKEDLALSPGKTR